MKEPGASKLEAVRLLGVFSFFELEFARSPTSAYNVNTRNPGLGSDNRFEQPNLNF